MKMKIASFLLCKASSFKKKQNKTNQLPTRLMSNAKIHYLFFPALKEKNLSLEDRDNTSFSISMQMKVDLC